jgi:glycosyltransferase involved in cell wall biosynthesis
LEVSQTNSNESLISILVPVYNVEEYLPRCMDSLLGQTHRELEIILINDGSTDKSGEICEHYKQIDSRVAVIHQENAGISAARNAGMEVMRGQWFALVDSDDYIDLQMFEKLLDNAIKNETLIASGGFVMHEPGVEDRYFVQNGLPLVITTEYYIENHAYGNWISSPWAMLYHRCLIEGDEKERLDVELYRGADRVFLLKLMLKVNKMTYLPEPVYHYIKREGSITTSGITEKSMSRFEAHRQIITLLISRYPKLAKLEQNKYTDYAVRWLWKTYKNPGACVQFRPELRKMAKEHATAYFLSKDVRFRKKVEFILMVFAPGPTHYIWVRLKKPDSGAKLT